MWSRCDCVCPRWRAAQLREDLFQPALQLLPARIFFPARWRWPKPDSRPTKQAYLGQPWVIRPLGALQHHTGYLPSPVYNRPCYLLLRCRRFSIPDQTRGHYRELSRWKSNIHGCNTFPKHHAIKSEPVWANSRGAGRLCIVMIVSGDFKKVQHLLTLGKTLVWGWTSPLVWELWEQGQRSDRGVELVGTVRYISLVDSFVYYFLGLLICFHPKTQDDVLKFLFCPQCKDNLFTI